MFILHAHVKSMNATVMGTRILVQGRWSKIWDLKGRVTVEPFKLRLVPRPFAGSGRAEWNVIKKTLLFEKTRAA